MKKLEDIKEFFMSSWAIDNRITTFVLTAIVTLMGVLAFNSLPKENFPEIAIPTIYVGTPYPGNTPENIEKNITYHIEKELKAITGVKKIKSQSIQDFSVVIVEFETNVDIDEAKLEVKDAVDKAKQNLPSDLPGDPLVQDINLSEVPIMFINVSADLPPDVLKKYSEDLQDQIESLKEIRRVDLLGVEELEVQVNLSLLKMQANGVAFGDITSAIGQRDVLISGGQVKIGSQEYSIQVDGKFTEVSQIGEIVIRNSRGLPFYLKDIAEVKLAFKDSESYARLNGTQTISLSVIKKAGENLVSASDKISNVIEEFKVENLPTEFQEEFEFIISGDQSYLTRNMLNNLTNTIIMGFILVTLVLMFFMGLRDSMFVGLSVPLSSLIAFVVLPWLGFTLNLVVLFTFIFALGIVVDNAIVVIENTYRIFNSTKVSIGVAAKKAAGEVIVPVFAGTLTTMAPFLPLAFWEGIVGEFMFFLPVTIIITLFASLLVAYVINPVFATAFMKRDDETKKLSLKGFFIVFGAIAVMAVLLYLGGNNTGGNILMIFGFLMLLYRFILSPAIRAFQTSFLPWMMRGYRNVLDWALRSWHPYLVLGSTIFLLFFSFGFFGANPPKVVFFPESDPNFIYIYSQLSVGTEIEKTNQVTLELERIVDDVLEGKEHTVKSIIVNVAKGAGSPQDFNQTSIFPNKSRIQIEFVPFQDRKGVSSRELLARIRALMKEEKRTNPKIPSDISITVDKEPSGPPTEKPVNIEVRGDDFAKVKPIADKLFAHLQRLAQAGTIEGIEELKTDVEEGKPQLNVQIDQTKASQLGMNTVQVGMALRTAVFGSEVSQFRLFEDEYPVMVRLRKEDRESIDMLKNMEISYRDMATGMFHYVPLSSVASLERSTALGGINRLDLKKAITISSNVLSDYNANEVVYEVIDYMNEWKKDNERLLDGVTVEMTGQILEQEETSAFLGGAMGASMVLIFLILIAQFNSLGKVTIIFSQIIFSITGVLLGFAFSGMEMSIVMVGVGVVSLAGIVVNNGIILLDFIGMMEEEGMSIKEAVIQGGSTRFTPIVLTASSTLLGLLPLALGLNINFETLFTELNPQLFMGGDTASFWGPLSWTIIYGLGFATLVTLVVVPVMYILFNRWGVNIGKATARISSGVGNSLTK